MNTVGKSVAGKKMGWGFWGLSAVAGLALLGASSRSFADSPYAMAPPIDAPYATAADSANVFGWQDVPQDQRVPIRRAIFDQGGYQLFDTVGETIVVPFENQNLYAMKFGVSDDGTTYFVNAGDAPVLYIPRNGYLENAAVSGSRWYPFPKEFHESTPVFIGIAPNWDDFCTMGWYPDMVCYGGYWGRDPFIAGSIFTPTFGLTFIIGGHNYDGWEPYHRYYDNHPAPYRVTVVNRRVYNIYNDRERNFNGHRDYSAFRGTGHPYDAGRSYDAGHPALRNGDRVFNGAGHPYTTHQADPGSRDYRSVRPTAPIGDHTFNSGGNNRTFNGGSRNNSDNRTFSGASGDRTFSNRTNSGDQTNNSYSGDRTFSGVGRTRTNDTGRPALSGTRPNAGTRSDTGTSGRTFGGVGSGRPAVDSATSHPSSTDHGSRADRSGTDRGGRAAPQSTDSTPRGTDSGTGNNGSRPQFQSNSRPDFNGGGRGGR